MLFLALFFVLLCIGLTLLFSPVVIRYTKDERSYLVVHFVFFSVTLSRKTAAEKEKERKKKKASGQKTGRSAKGRAVLRALPGHEVAADGGEGVLQRVMAADVFAEHLRHVHG